MDTHHSPVTPSLMTIVTLIFVINLIKDRESLAFSNLQFGRERIMEEKTNFDERYHASYAAKLKTVPLDKVENTIARSIGELTHDNVECIITRFNTENEYAELTLTLNIGKDKRYAK